MIEIDLAKSLLIRAATTLAQANRTASPVESLLLLDLIASVRAAAQRAEQISDAVNAVERAERAE